MKELFSYKKSKITLIVSWILAGIMLIVGIILTVDVDDDTNKSTSSSPAYSGNIPNLFLNSAKHYSGQEIMYKFSPSNSGRYEIQTSTNGYYEVYVLKKNSQREIDNGDYVYHGSKSNTSYSYVSLSQSESYYIYVISDSDGSISVKITES